LHAQLPQRKHGSIGKAYNAYAWYKQLTDKRIFFVTRLNSNAKYRIIDRRSAMKNKGLMCDQTIEFTGPLVSKKCPAQLRRAGYKDAETGKSNRLLARASMP
jgi:hypothetical protein